MLRLRDLILATWLVSGLTAAGAMAQAYSPGPPSRSAMAAGVRHQIGQAQSELIRAYAAAYRSDAMAADVKQAQSAMVQARRDYAAAVVAAKAAIPLTPELTRLRTSVKEMQDRLDAEKDVHDWTTRLAAASDLMAARTQLNAIENAAIAGDADLAVAKATVTDTANALKDVQARRLAMIQQDPQVLAARQKLDGLRKQLFARR